MPGCHERNECFPASWLICRSGCDSGRSPEILRLFSDPSLLSAATSVGEVRSVRGSRVANHAVACIPRAISALKAHTEWVFGVLQETAHGAGCGLWGASALVNAPSCGVRASTMWVQKSSQ